MRSVWLVVLLVVYALFALSPALAWLAAGTFEFVDDGWKDWLPVSIATWPVALGLAACTLAVHGLRVNAHFRAEAEVQLDEIEERQRTVIARSEALVPVGVGGGSVAVDAEAPPAADAVTVSTPRGSKTAPIARGEPISGAKSGRDGKRGGGAKRHKRRAMSMARRQMRRRTGF